jgi:hypothetical protein
MSRTAWSRILVALGVVGILIVLPTAARAQEAAGAAADDDTTAAYKMAGVASLLGTLVYAPLKAVVLCPLSAVGAGVAYVAAGGESAPADRVLHIGCGGSYAITRGMIRGQQEIEMPDPPSAQLAPRDVTR